MAAAARWFIARNNEKVGPFGGPELQQLAHFGMLKASENVWLEGSTKWIPASSIPGLFTPAGEKKYWIVLHDRTHGPYVAEQVRAGLNAHQFTLDNLACTDDARQWMPIRQLTDFKDFQLETVPMTPSRAQLLTGSLDLEEAALYLAGKGGDIPAKLIATLTEMKRNYASNAGLVETLDTTIAALRAKRDQPPKTNVPAVPKSPL